MREGRFILGFFGLVFLTVLPSVALAVDCAAGKYWDGTGCATCTRGYYCTGFSNVTDPAVGHGLTECPPDYTDGDPGATNKNQCMITTPPGYYTMGYGLLVCFELGYNCLGNIRVKWGSAGGYAFCPVKEYSDVSGAVACKMCPEGYQSSTTTGKKTINLCQANTVAGKYIATPFDIEGTTCPEGSYCTGGVKVNYGEIGGISACPEGYADGASGRTAIGQCAMKLPEGYYIKTAKDSVPTKCTEPGYSCPGSVVNYSSVGGQVICSGATYSGIPGASACSNCPDGYNANTTAGKGLITDCQINVTAGKYVADATSSTLTVCPAGYYCPVNKLNYGSANTPTACPSGYTFGTPGADDVSKCSIKTSAGKYIATANSTTETNCPAGSYCPPATVNYGGTGSILACPGDYNDGAAGLSNITDCKIQTSNGKYIAASNDLTETDCPAGYYCQSQSIQFGGFSTLTPCTGATYSSSGAASCAVCPTGYVANTDEGKTAISQCQFQTTYGYMIENPGDTFETACAVASDCPATLVNYGHSNSVTQCTGGFYLSGGNCVSCPTGYKDEDSVNKTAITQCAKKVTAGYYIRTANSDVETICPANSYCPGALITYGSTGGIITCPTGYTSGTTGSVTINDCKLKTNGGKYVQVAESSTTVNCPAGYYCPSEFVNYGSVNTPTPCPAGEYSTLMAATCISCPTGYEAGPPIKTVQTDCQMNVSPGFYILNAKDSAPTPCPVGEYCSGGLIAYNSKGGKLACTGATYSDTLGASECKLCPTRYNSNVTAGKTSINQCQTVANAGKYIANAGDTVETLCTAGHYCSGGLINFGNVGIINQCMGATYSAGGATNCTVCPTGYTANIDPGKTSIEQCQILVNATKYIGTPYSATQTNCPAGSYCPFYGPLNYGSVIMPTKCTGATFSLGGTMECEECAVGYRDDLSEGKVSYTGCKKITTPGEYIQAARDLVGTPCPAGKYCPSATVSFNSTNSYMGCPLGYLDGPIGAGAITDCQKQTNPGTYITTPRSVTLTNCGVGYYCPATLINYESIGSRFACPEGSTTRGTGLGADEPGDCGHVLRIGANKLYLRSDKKTSPSLNLNYNGTIYYGNATTDQRNGLKLNSGGVTYSIYDDGM